MSSVASNDRAELRTAAGSVRTIALEAQVASVVTTAEMIMVKPWGNDTIGQAFATVYLPAATTVMDAVLDTGPQLGMIADTLQKSSGQYADTEQTNTDSATVEV